MDRGRIEVKRVIDVKTKEKIKALKEKQEPMGCLGCLGKVDDGYHEYDEQFELWYCPSMDEE